MLEPSVINASPCSLLPQNPLNTPNSNNKIDENADIQRSTVNQTEVAILIFFIFTSLNNFNTLISSGYGLTTTSTMSFAEDCPKLEKPTDVDARERWIQSFIEYNYLWSVQSVTKATGSSSNDDNLIYDYLAAETETTYTTAKQQMLQKRSAMIKLIYRDLQ